MRVGENRNNAEAKESWCIILIGTKKEIFDAAPKGMWYTELGINEPGKGKRIRTMQYVLEKGAPSDASARLEKEKRCYQFLDGCGVEYWRCDHPDANADTMEACMEIDRVLEAAVCKNLFLCNRQHTEFYLLMMPGDKVFKTKELSSQLGCARLSFASAEEMEEYLDITPGSVSVLGLMNDTNNKVRLLVDEDLLESTFIGCHPCINTSSLKVYTKDLFGKLLKELHHEMTVVKLVGEE